LNDRKYPVERLVINKRVVRRVPVPPVILKAGVMLSAVIGVPVILFLIPQHQVLIDFFVPIIHIGLQIKKPLLPVVKKTIAMRLYRKSVIEFPARSKGAGDAGRLC
jgi:hypothetical protein